MKKLTCINDQLLDSASHSLQLVVRPSHILLYDKKNVCPGEKFTKIGYTDVQYNFVSFLKGNERKSVKLQNQSTNSTTKIYFRTRLLSKKALIMIY